MVDILPAFSVFLLIFVRVASFFLTVPIFSYRTVPAMFKIGIAFFLALTMFFVVDSEPIPIDHLYYMLILKEAMVGIILGFIGYLILSAVQIAGGFIDFQMGFAIANVMDPQTGAQSPIIGQYLYMFAFLFLLSVNGHHLLLDGIYYSYQFIPLDQVFIHFHSENMVQFILKLFSQMFVIAFQLSIPVVACLFLVDLALGIVARTVPQLNVFVVGLPLKIMVSFLVLFVVIGAMIFTVGELFDLILRSMRAFMEIVGV